MLKSWGQRRSRALSAFLVFFVCCCCCSDHPHSTLAIPSSSASTPRRGDGSKCPPKRTKKERQKRGSSSTTTTTSSGKEEAKHGDEYENDDDDDDDDTAFYKGLLETWPDEFLPLQGWDDDDNDDYDLFFYSYDDNDDKESSDQHYEAVIEETGRSNVYSYYDEEEEDEEIEEYRYRSNNRLPHNNKNNNNPRVHDKMPTPSSRSAAPDKGVKSVSALGGGQSMMKANSRATTDSTARKPAQNRSPPNRARFEKSTTTVSTNNSQHQSRKQEQLPNTKTNAEKASTTEPLATQKFPCRATIAPPLSTPPATQKNNDNTVSTVMSGMTPWVRTFLATRPGLLIIPRDFWLDNFNLAQLPPVLESWVKVSLPLLGKTTTTSITMDALPSGLLYKQALRRILAQQDDNCDDKEGTASVSKTKAAEQGAVAIEDNVLHLAASLLYQIVHQRYALSPRGLDALRRRFIIWKYQTVKRNPLQPPPYGRCPRASCHGYALVPSGPDYPRLSDKGYSNNNIDYVECSRPWRYCGSCLQTWRSMSTAESEGCAWGKSIGPLFHLTFPCFLHATQTSSATRSASNLSDDEPRVFGYRLHPGAAGLFRSKQ